jgi:ubiquinone/menaquinone biosynthesis C-methylase UbiE
MADKTVKLVTCIVSMHHFRDFPMMIKEIQRVLKFDGYLFIREHDVPPHNTELSKKLVDLHLKYEDHRPEEPINFWGRKELRIELANYGFSHICDSDFEDQ